MELLPVGYTLLEEPQKPGDVFSRQGAVRDANLKLRMVVALAARRCVDRRCFRLLRVTLSSPLRAWDALEYVRADRLTGNRTPVIYRVDRVSGDQLHRRNPLVQRASRLAAKLWYAPELQRVVRFEAQNARPPFSATDETLELVRVMR